MKYIHIEFDNIEYWIELDDEGYALRQVIDDNGNIEISCKTDCLAEGSIKLEDLEGVINIINFNNFEEKWNSIIKKFRYVWNEDKKKYYIGRYIQGKIKYFYPQGVVLQIENSQGICYYNKKNRGDNNIGGIGKDINGVVTGYDESNMWLIVSLDC